MAARIPCTLFTLPRFLLPAHVQVVIHAMNTMKPHPDIPTHAGSSLVETLCQELLKHFKRVKWGAGQGGGSMARASAYLFLALIEA